MHLKLFAISNTFCIVIKIVGHTYLELLIIVIARSVYGYNQSMPVSAGGRRRKHRDRSHQLPVHEANRETATEPVGHRGPAAKTQLLETVRLQRRLLLRQIEIQPASPTTALLFFRFLLSSSSSSFSFLPFFLSSFLSRVCPCVNRFHVQCLASK